MAIGAILAAVYVVIALIASGGGDDNNATVAETTPAATTPTATATIPSVTSPAATPPAAAAPTAKPVVRSEKCAPIIGSGTANGGVVPCRWSAESSTEWASPQAAGSPSLAEEVTT